jgi:FixJ family two-component response regulator
MTIAVIDDDSYVRSGMVGLLRSLGLSATSYASADDFLASSRDDFGCIVSDVQMPGSSGLELLELLIAQGDATPVILMTASPEPRMLDLAISSGAVGILEKPINSQTLVNCLERVLGPIV